MFPTKMYQCSSIVGVPNSSKGENNIRQRAIADEARRRLRKAFVRTLRPLIGLNGDQSHAEVSTLTCVSRSLLSAQPWAMSPYLDYAVGALSSALLLALPPACTCAVGNLCLQELLTHNAALCLTVSYCLCQDFLEGPWTWFHVWISSSWWTPLPAPDSAVL